jgi:hypothetical protein
MLFQSKKSKQLLKQKIDDLATSNKGQITQHEACGNFILGIDAPNKHLYFYQKTTSDLVELGVDLNAYKSCTVIKNMTGGNGAPSVLELVELRLIPKSPPTKEIRLQLYHESVAMNQVGEVQFAEQWSKKINEILQQKA